ncbi:uncharacterized protein YALI1_B08588g [Yarrowia lipolytica]|uniref:Uncharacterized protein n=1 Tax=Yarrowia lipolytica TaxID=4952 RepID=A0A1D8N6Q2_YARLL|nr:hypothetical protein YALI1_B08588g [Yarrowia lipolytica]
MFGNLGFHVIWGAPIVVANEVNDVFTPVVDSGWFGGRSEKQLYEASIGEAALLPLEPAAISSSSLDAPFPQLQSMLLITRELVPVRDLQHLLHQDNSLLAWLPHLPTSMISSCFVSRDFLPTRTWMRITSRNTRRGKLLRR